MSKNELYFFKRDKFIVNGVSENKDCKSDRYVASMLKNFEAYGYTCSKELIDLLCTQDVDFLSEWYDSAITLIVRRVGKISVQPMYPNFPKQVMELSRFELYLNAIVHYVTEGHLIPDYQKDERFPLIDNVNLKVIGLGSDEDFENIFVNLLSSKSSISPSDKDIIEWFVKNQENMFDLIPDNIPMKENLTYFTALLISNGYADNMPKSILSMYKTSTDVLRLAVAISGGDISLSIPTRFVSMNMATRRLLLSMLNKCSSNMEEDMVLYREEWKRLGEVIHPLRYKKRYPRACKAIDKMRSGDKVPVFFGKVERAFADNDVCAAVKLLSLRPGVYARSLDRLIRASKDDSEIMIILDTFSKIAKDVATPILLQLMSYFEYRKHADNKYRTFFPKGTISKMYYTDMDLEPLREDICDKIIHTCKVTLQFNFLINKDCMGKVYIDEALKDYIVPTSLRTAQKSLRTIARGSKIRFSDEVSTIRPFLYWKNPSFNERTDLDLSAIFLDEKFKYKGDLYYGNLRDSEVNCCHSGDIVNAPRGAVEYLDIDIDSVRKAGIRYVGITVNSFTRTPFIQLPDCFVGFMEREDVNTGEVFEPKTVRDRVDLTINSESVLAFLIDVVERTVIWVEMPFDTGYMSINNIESNRDIFTAAMESMVSVVKPNLYDLILLNAQTRGIIVDNKEDADTIFSVYEGITPSHTDIILSDLL